MVGTGAAALMAIRVLLDHEVPEVTLFERTIISFRVMKH